MTSENQKARGYKLPNPITGNPLICMSMMIPDHPQYRDAVYGAVTELSKWWNWEKSYEDGDTRASQVAQVMTQLIFETYQVNTECFPDESGCLEYHNLSYIIEYLPNHPTDQTTPPGYLFPPWYIAPDINLIGAPAGAVVTDITRFPYAPGQPAETLPRFRVRFNGTGSVELHLIAINFGGNAIIQVDGDLGQIEVVDLNQDITAIPPETEDVIIIEREITTPGAHFIDVTMTPVLQNEIPPVLFGGGLLKVVLCGFDDMARELEIQAVDVGDGCQQLQKKYVDQDESEWVDFGNPICNGQDGREIELQMSPIDALCQQPQWRYVGESEWTDFGDPVCSGAQGIPGECPDCDETPEFPEPDPETLPEGENPRCLAAAAMTKAIRDSLTETIEEVGAGGDAVSGLAAFFGIIALFGLVWAAIAAGVAALVSAIINVFASGGEVVYDDDDWEKLKCIFYCHIGEDGRLDQSEFDLVRQDVEAEIEDHFEWEFIKNNLDIFGVEGLNNAARLVLVTDADCAGCDCGCTNFGITFDEETEEYTIVQGSLNAFGFTGQSVLAPLFPLGGDAKKWEAMVDVPTSTDCPIGEASAMIWDEVYNPSADPVPFPFIAQAWLDGVMVAEVSSAEVHPNGTWQNIHLTFPPSTFADKVRFIAWNDTSTPGRGIDVFIDNLEIAFG